MGGGRVNGHQFKKCHLSLYSNGLMEVNNPAQGGASTGPHNLKVTGSNPVPATNEEKPLYQIDTAAY